MRNFKRVLSFLLTLIMLAGMVPSLGLNVLAATDDVPGYGSLTRIVTFNIGLDGGTYYHTNFGDSEYQVSKENVGVSDGYTGTIEVRMYHEENKTNHDSYGDYLGVVYVNGKAVSQKAVKMDKLLLTIFYSVYKEGYSIQAYNFNAGAENQQAYIYPYGTSDSIIGSIFNREVLLSKSSWNMPVVWLDYDADDPESSHNGKTVTLDAGPEGNGKTYTVKIYENTSHLYTERLYTNQKAINDLLGFYPHRGTSDQRVFIGWAEGYDSTSHQGTGKMYTSLDAAFTGDDGDTLYAIWGYPIMFDADGGIYADGTDEYLTYVADHAAWNGDSTDPASRYIYVNPDNLGNAPVKEGARRYEGRNAYGLIDADGKTFFTWEGDSENLTIPPTGGNTNADGSYNSYEWSDFRCTDADDSNNPYGIKFPEFVAIWEPSVTYYPNGGTGSVKTDWLEWDYGTLYNYKALDTRDADTFTKTGATFVGWNTSPDGTGIAYDAGDNIGGKRPNSDPIKLYAQWSDDSYIVEGEFKVTLDPNGGSVSASGTNGTLSGGKLVCVAENGKTYGEIIGTLPTPTRSGYIFEGWWYEQADPYYDGPYLQNPGQGWFLDTDAKFIIPKDVTFEAKWIENPTVKSPNSSKTYKMTFDPNGGTLIGPSVYYINNGDTYYSIFGDSEPVVYRKGYTLEGWFDTTYNYHLRTEYPNEKYSVTVHSTWKAKWTKIEDHDCVWTNISSIPPTCTEAGTTTQGCFCGDTRNVTVKAKGHTFDTLYGVRSNADCVNDRVDIYMCSACGDATEDKVATGTALGHDWSTEWYYAKAEDMPTCEGTGTQTADCMRVGCDEVTTQTVDPIGHDYVGTVIPAYCECEETMLYVCQNDPEHWYEEATGNASALGHTFSEPYDNGEGYTIIECIRESDGINPECPHFVKTANRYNIIYDLVLPGATFGADTPMYHTYDQVTTLVDPTATNATFAGWYLDREYTMPVTEIGAQEIMAPVKYYAKWTINIELYSASTKHHLYDDEGNSLGEGKNTTITMVYGEDIRIPYRWWNNTNVFNGWTNAAIETLDQNGIIPGYAFTANARLTASYSVNSFPIVYHDVTYGGVLTADTDYITNGASLTKSITYNSASKGITVVLPVKPGYTAKLYKTLEAAESGTGNITTINQNSITATNYPNAQIDVYVVWTLTTSAGFKVVLDDNGGTMTNPAGTTIATATVSNHIYNLDSDLTGLIGGITKNGYSFKGWSTSATYGSGTVYFTGLDKIPANTVSAAATLYAVWEPNEFVVEYVLENSVTGVKTVLNDETAADLDVTNWATLKTKLTHIYGTHTSSIPTKPTITGHTGQLWYFNDGSALSNSNTRINNNKTYWGDGTGINELRTDGKYYIVLTAKYAPNSYTVTLDDNGGTMTNAEGTTKGTLTFTHVYDQTSDLTSVIGSISRTGYTFMGWSTSATYGEGIVYTTEMKSMPAKSVPAADILYAVWAPNTFKIEFRLDGIVLTEETAEQLQVTNYAALSKVNTHTYGANTTVGAAKPVRTGYTTTNWQYKDGTTLTTSSATRIIAAKTYWGDPSGLCELRDDGIYYIVLSSTSTLTTPAGFKVILDDNGGTMTNPDGGTIGTATVTNHIYNQDSDLTGLIGSITRKGYNFKGWSTSDDYGAGTVYFTGIDKIPANTVPVSDTLYAVWEPEVYRIEYYVDGVLLTEESAAELGILNYEAILAKSVHKYGTATADLVRVQRTGYSSTANWSYDPSGAPVISGHDITATYCNYDDNGEDFVIKVYSVTTPDDVRVVFRTPDGTSVGAANLNAYFGIDNAWPMVDYGDTYILPTETLRDGYHLAGLYSDTACTKRITYVKPSEFITTYNQGTTYTDYNVYVKWEKLEETAPTGTIDLGVDAAGMSTEFITPDKIVYGIYANSFNNIVITGDKGNNYVAPTVEYYLSATALTLAQAEALTEWTIAPNGEAFALPEGTPDGEYIIYVKITDDQGNVAYISSQRFVYDTTAPVFETLTDAEYCYNTELGLEFRVDERYLDKFTVNGEAADLSATDTYTLIGAEDGADYVVYAKDKAGNTTTVTVKVFNSHVYESEVTLEPNCTDTGIRTYTCTRCGDIYTEEIPALGHKEADAVVENSKDATCTENGSYDVVVYCSVCNAELSRTTEKVPALGHTKGEYIVLDHKDATCTESGSHTEAMSCTVCNTELDRKVSFLPKLGHDEIAHDAKAVTCTEIGWDAYVTCSRCDYTTYVEIPAAGHKYDAVITAPTCTEAGYTTYTCSVCGDTYKADEVAASGHNPAEAVKENVIDATCTTDGSYESVVYCTVCDEELSRTKEKVPALGHTEGEYVVEKHVDATCEENGVHIEAMYCTVCNEKLDETVQILFATGHDWSDAIYNWAADGKACEAKRICNNDASHVEFAYEKIEKEVTVPATCMEMGTTTYTATFDMDLDWVEPQTTTRVDIPVNPDAHAWDEGVVTAPTCTAQGYTTYTCQHNAEHTKKENVTEMLPHTEGEAVKENVIDATCTADGSYESVVYCQVCDEELSRQTVTVSAFGHEWDDGVVTVAPTCAAEGVMTYTCQNDSAHTYTEAIEKLPHTPVIDEAVDPTCTETGLTEGSHCDVCGEVFIAQVIIPATGHSPADAVKENEIDATCTTDGSYESVVYCTVCDAELSRTKEKVPALGHTKGEYVVISETPATCENNGSVVKAQYCTVCDEKLDEIVTILPKLGHDYEVTDHKDANCTEDGYDVYTCKNDKTHTYTTVLTKLGHAEITHEEKAPTCTEIGWEAYVTCSKCDYTTYVEIPAAGHKYDAVITAPTCTEAGYTTYTCSVCGDTYKADEVAALGHAPAVAVEENRVDAQCGVPGSYDMVVYCSVCNVELSRESFTIEALTHEYAFEVNAEDGYVQCIYCDHGYNGFFLDEETGNYYYAAGEDGKTTEGLFVVDGYYYYGLAEEYGNLVCDTVYMITFEEKEAFNAANAEYALNGRNSCYLFGADYRIVPDGFVTGQMYRDTVADDPYAERTFYYENYQLVIGLRLFDENDSMVYRYFNDWHGFMYQNTRLWIHDFENAEEGTSGYNPYGLPHGYYNFDENGIMIMPEGYVIVNHNGYNYLTLDGVKQPQGLYEIETGKYVYVKHGKTVAQNECQWLTDTSKNGLIDGVNCFYYFGEDFALQVNCFVEIGGKTYYINEKAEALLGFNKIGDDYYFFNAKTGLMYKDTVLWVGENPYGVKVENHYFMADGKMFVDTGVFAPVLTEENGNLYITIDGVKQYYGLFEIDGDFYFAQGNGIVARDATVWVSNTNGLVESKGYYSFDSEGKMILSGFMTTEKGYTYYYDNGVLAKGFTKIGDHYYLFNASSGMMYKDSTMWIGANNAYGFAAGYYYFDAEGKLFIANEETGVKKVIYENGYYYFTIDNVKQINGIYELDGDYYYAKADGKLYADTTLILSDAVAGEFGGTVGYYAFDAEAKLVKTGFVTGGGYTYYYDNLVLAKGLTQIGEDIYLFNASSGTMYMNYKAWVGASNALGLPYGYYYFGADGKCTGKVG